MFIKMNKKTLEEAIEELDKQGWMSSKPVSMTDKEIVEYLKQIDKPNNLSIALPAEGERVIFTSLDQIESIEVFLGHNALNVYIKNVGKVGLPDTEYYRELLGINPDLLETE